MRWLLAGLAFALAVGLAIGTAAIRADNTRLRLLVERDYTWIRDCQVEQARLEVRAQEESTPDRLAVELRKHLRRFHDRAAVEVAP